MFVNNTYEWVVEGDITACFDEISHSALLERVRQRIGDKRVLALVKAFLKAGIFGEDGMLRDSRTGAPQGGILSPLLSNVALSVLDEYIAQIPGGPSSTTVERAKRKRHGLSNYRLIRYADDWLLLVTGTREHAEGMRDQAAAVLAPMGLRLSEEKTKITHIDEGVDFLGWRIQRHRKRGTNRHYIYWYPSRKAVKAITGKVKMLCRRMDTNEPLDALLRQLNAALRGWCTYFRPGQSARTFSYLSAYLWQRVIGWLRRKHRRTTWKELRRRYCGGRWWPSGQELGMFNPAKVRTTRYLYRGVIGIPSPWPTTG
jgi:RNA-directed DNA polymerase